MRYRRLLNAQRSEKDCEVVTGVKTITEMMPNENTGMIIGMIQFRRSLLAKWDVKSRM